jgi:hypothetical protein
MVDQWFSPAIAPAIPFSLPAGKRGRGEFSLVFDLPQLEGDVLTLMYRQDLSDSGSSDGSSSGPDTKKEDESDPDTSTSTDDEVEVIEAPKPRPRPTKRIRRAVGMQSFVL